MPHASRLTSNIFYHAPVRRSPFGRLPPSSRLRRTGRASSRRNRVDSTINRYTPSFRRRPESDGHATTV